MPLFPGSVLPGGFVNGLSSWRRLSYTDEQAFQQVASINSSPILPLLPESELPSDGRDRAPRHDLPNPGFIKIVPLLSVFTTVFFEVRAGCGMSLVSETCRWFIAWC